jgi:predicted aminopeptidase
MLLRLLVGLGVASAAFLGLTPIGRYLARGAWEEVRILTRRQPIEEILRDSSVDAVTRAKLQLVLDARAFAVDTLGLAAKKSFTTFTQLESDTLVLVLTVAHRDSLAIRSWWWPVVGRVPYQGFFDFDDARRRQQRYEREGYDTELRPSSAFSTLGWFNDPVLSSTLRSDSIDLVNTVIHELLHNTVWIRGDANFNESFASFVGREGASLFFQRRGDSASMMRLARNRPFEEAIGRFYEGLYSALDSAFRALPGAANRERRIAARDTIFAKGRDRLANEIAPAFGIRDTTWARRVRLNIATLLARRVYRDDAAEFEALYEKLGRNLPATIARISTIAREARRGEAFEAVAREARGDIPAARDTSR